MDYLDQRDKTITHVLERIEGRLGHVEEHLEQTARAHTPQGPPVRERHRGGRRSNRSDPTLRVRYGASAGVRFPSDHDRS